MAIFAVWPELNWDREGWDQSELPSNTGAALKYVQSGEVSVASFSGRLSQIPMSFFEVPGALTTGVIDLVLHDTAGYWTTLRDHFASNISLDVTRLFETPLLQARVREDGTFKKIKYLNVTETTGTEDADDLKGNQKLDFVRAGDGDDTVSGRGGADQLYGERGRDTLSGGDGDDLLLGGNGRDTLDAGAGIDTLQGGRGNDLLLGGEGYNWMYGGAGNDTIQGAGGFNRMFGGAGKDVLRGGVGDTLDGGRGRDVLLSEGGTSFTGGAGADRFVFKGIGKFFVEDFETGVDMLDLSRMPFDAEPNIFSLDGMRWIQFDSDDGQVVTVLLADGASVSVDDIIL